MNKCKTNGKRTKRKHKNLSKHMKTFKTHEHANQQILNTKKQHAIMQHKYEHMQENMKTCTTHKKIQNNS